MQTKVKSTMTPRERVACAMSGRKPDKLPILVSASNSFICERYGISVEDYLSKPELCADAHIKFIREFDLDYCVVGTGYILYGCGPEVGITWKFVDDNFPGFVEGPLKSPSDIERITVPTVPSGYFKSGLETIRRVNEVLGESHHLTASILGPFSMACFLRGTENALMDTLANPEFFKAYMQRSAQFSVYFGKNVLATGLRNPILNEIFLSPGMLRPDDYHRLIAPHIIKVQKQLGEANAPNGMGAFMGKPNDPQSQKGGAALYKAFFGTTESIDAIKEASRYVMAGWPFPASISGRALSGWDTDRVLAFLKKAVDFLVTEQGIYPSLSLVSVIANSSESAEDIANKMHAIKEFRDGYNL